MYVESTIWAESEKDGEPRKQVPEEGFECEEGLTQIPRVIVAKESI